MFIGNSKYDYLNSMEYINDDPNISPEAKNLIDEIVKYNIATNDEIELVCSIKDWTISTLNDIIRIRTGYDDISSYVGEVYPDRKVKGRAPVNSYRNYKRRGIYED